MWDKLKKRWDVDNGWDVAVILIVFACTGFSVMYAKRGLYHLIGLNEDSATWLRWLVAIVIILPLYQVLLLMWGWLWGKFDFFWKFEQRMLSRLGGLFRKRG
ncbi:MAG: prolipoprotein diacylglyceryl transferase [Bacteroidetes bacterium]|nr:prolipoprotein diacylglyceryl transferase [Bacteroidota bacterium]